MARHLRLATQAVVASAVTLVINNVYHQSHGFWSTMTVLFLLANNRGEMLKKGLTRVTMTFLGCITAALLLCYLPTDSFVLGLIILASSFTALYFFSVDYAKSVFFITISIMMVLFVGFNETSSDILFARVEETTLGAVISLMVSIYVFPRSAEQELATLKDEIITTLFEWYQHNTNQSKYAPATYSDLFGLLNKLEQYSTTVGYCDYEKWFTRTVAETNHFKENLLLQLIVGNTLHIIQTIDLQCDHLSQTEIERCTTSANLLFSAYHPHSNKGAPVDRDKLPQPTLNLDEPLPISGLTSLLKEQQLLFEQLFKTGQTSKNS